MTQDTISKLPPEIQKNISNEALEEANAISANNYHNPVETPVTTAVPPVTEVLEENKTVTTPVSTYQGSMDTALRNEESREDKLIAADPTPVAPQRPMSDEEYEAYLNQIQNDDSMTSSSVIEGLDDDDFYNDTTEPTPVASAVPETPSFENDFYSDSKSAVTPVTPKVNFSYAENESFEDEEEEEESENEFGSFEDENEDEENIYYKSYADQNANRKSTANPKLDFVNNLTVDLNNIVITEKPVLQQIEDFNLVFDTSKSTFTVVCCQSAYQASLSGLTLSEKNAINNSESDLYTARQKLYKTVYNKIVNMNFPKPKFDDWLKITSFGDWNTLLFGIYCQTFVEDNDFDITCGHCGKATPVTVNNQSLIEARDKRVFDKIEEIVYGIKSAEELIQHSVVHKHFRIMLNDSKVIIDIASPTLWDHLALIKQSNPKTLAEYADTFSQLLFIKNMYMIDAKTSYTTGRANYYPVSSKAKMLDVLLKLSNSDGEQLEAAIDEKLGQYQLTYKIHNATCMHCHEKLPDIPVDMETVLFRRINKRQRN